MTFTPDPSMQAQRFGCAAVLLPGNRRVLVVGGFDRSAHLATADILDIDTMTLSPGPVMSLGRSSCDIVSQPGSILVVGGNGGAGTNTAEALSIETMSFAPGPTMRTVRLGSSAFALPQNHSPHRALVVGGHDVTSNLATTEFLTAAN